MTGKYYYKNDVCDAKGWDSPFTDRFPRADWMQWPWPAAPSPIEAREEHSDG